jgi:hypothetical protein
MERMLSAAMNLNRIAVEMLATHDQMVSNADEYLYFYKGLDFIIGRVDLWTSKAMEAHRHEL